MPSFTLAELQARLGGVIQGDPTKRVTSAASLEHALPHQLSFILGAKYLPQAKASKAGALVMPEALASSIDGDALIVGNPHVAFATALSLLHPEPFPPEGIHPSAVIAPDAQLGPNVRIGAGVIIGAGAVIGANCVLGAGSHIGPHTLLGDGCLLHPRSTVEHGCHLGQRVVLQAGCVVGSDGFGLAWNNEQWIKVPQVGRAILGNDVEVGANTTIDRGALDDTVLEEGVKLDNQIQIAHNCRIGRHTAIAACVGIAGSTTIGAYCQIGGAAMIIGHLDICDRVTISAGTFVAKNIRSPGVYTSVQPLMAHADWKRNAAHLRHLDTLSQRIQELERHIKNKDIN